MTLRRIYLDFNATTPLCDGARDALIAALDSFGNPSSVHGEGRAAKALLQQARRDVATLVGGDIDNIVFTGSATEAAMTALTPDYRMGRSPLKMSHLYIGATEHPCIANGGRFSKEDITIIPVAASGLIQLDILEQALQSHDKAQGLPLVAIQLANPESGVLQPMEDIARLVKAAGGVLVVDAVQYLGKNTLDITAGYGDFFIITAHKIGGPKGIGALVASGSALMPEPLIVGGGQERGHRGGTESIPLIVAFGAAARAVHARHNESARLRELQIALENGIMSIAPECIIHGRETARLPNTTFFSLPDMKAETMQIAFDLAGIAVSAGSACASGKVGGSAVLKAMGIGDTNGAIRVSTGWLNSHEDVLYFLEVLQKIIERKKK